MAIVQDGRHDDRGRTVTAYRITVGGRLPGAASRVLSDLGAMELPPAGPTSLLEVIDQSALIGLLNRMHALGLVIERVVRVDAPD